MLRRLRGGGRRGTLGLSKVCNIEDFAHPELRDTIRAVFGHDVARFGAEYPRGREYRKYWEVGMAVRALEAAGVLGPKANVLGVAAGNEPTIFWLTNRVGRVYATDLYLDPGVWTEFANSSMMVEPGRHWPGPWNPRRLVVQHMNALDLQYEDGSFDAIFSSSSIEHFGTVEAVHRSMSEMFRVLRPGGVLSVSTEFRLAGPPPGRPGCMMFSEAELFEALVGNRGWSLITPFDGSVSRATRRSVQPVEDYIADWHRHFAEHDGQTAWHELEFRKYPQLVLRDGDHVFVSTHLALRKD